MKVKNNKTTAVSSIIGNDKPINKLTKVKNWFGKRYGLFLLLSPLVLFFVFGVGFISFIYFYQSGAVLGKKSTTPTYNVYSGGAKESKQFDVQTSVVDGRADKVEAFFNKYGAPLAPYSEFIVEMADKYEIDWKLVSAIGYCEGNGGKAIPEGSFNTWGWGASEADLAAKSGKYNLGSWENAIETVTRGLKKYYIDQGLKTPEQIMPKYAPPSVEKGGPWAKCVNQYLHEIDNITQD